MDPRDSESIFQDLRSPDDEVRRLAVERVGLLAPLEAIPTLVGCLGDASWRVRKAAIDRLVGTPEPARAASSLLDSLADGDNPGRRNAALEALIRCGSSVVPTLLEATGHADVDVRKQVIDALSGIADPSAVPRLQGLLVDCDSNVRAAAADALGAIGQADCAPVLLGRVAGDPERLVRLSALLALGRLEVSVALEALEASLADSALQPAALALLGHSDDPMAFEVLLKGLGSASRSAREAAMGAILRVAGSTPGNDLEPVAARVRDVALGDERLMRGAVERLEEGTLSVRLVVAQFLSLVRDTRTIVPMIRAGADEALTEVVVGALQSFGPSAGEFIDGSWAELDGEGRVLATQVLGKLDDAAGERRLLEALTDSLEEVRTAAIRALGGRRSSGALAGLVRRFGEAAEDSDAASEEVELLADAIAAIAEGDASAMGALDGIAAQLPEAGESFRKAAARLLIGSACDSPALGVLLSDPSDVVRRAAVEALARARAGERPESLRLALADESPSVRIAAAAALVASSDPSALEDLERLAQDEDATVRAASMRAAGAMPPGPENEHFERRLGLLERGVADDGPVAMAALEGLRELDDPRAVGVAARLLDAAAPELVCAAVACVGRSAELPRLEMLLPLLEHESWSVRAEAVRVLGERGVRRAVPTVLRRLEAERDEFVRAAILRALERLEG